MTILAPLARAANFPSFGVHRTGHDEVVASLDLDPIGQLVVVGVGIVENAALLHEQPAGVLTRSEAAVPAKRALSGRAPERGDRERDTLTLRFLAQAKMLLPAPAMAADVEI